MRAVFTALLLASSASADFILQQTWADDACQTSVSLSIYLSPAGPVDQNGCTKSAAGGGSGSPTSYRIVCTPSGPGLYNVSSYLGAGCNGAPTSISPQDRGGCNGRGISQSCVVGTVFPAGPTSGAVVTKGGYGSEVKSCPVPSSAVESQIRIIPTDTCLTFAPSIALQGGPVSARASCSTAGGGFFTVTSFPQTGCAGPGVATNNATGCVADTRTSGSSPYNYTYTIVSDTTCYPGAVPTSTGTATATSGPAPSTSSGPAPSASGPAPSASGPAPPTATGTASLPAGASPSRTPSPSLSSTGTDSASFSGSNSATPTSSLSRGASPSTTSTASLSSSATATPTATLSTGASPSITSTRSNGALAAGLAAQANALASGAVAAIVIVVILVFVVAPLGCLFCGAAACCAACRGSRTAKLMAPGAATTTVVQLSPLGAHPMHHPHPHHLAPPPPQPMFGGGQLQSAPPPPHYAHAPRAFAAAAPPPPPAAPAMRVGPAQQLPPGWQVHTDGVDSWYTDAAGQSHWSLPQHHSAAV